jgi:uncharacterized protein
MLIVVSPAKKLDYTTTVPTDEFTQPEFLKKAQQLISKLKKCSAEEVSNLMGLSKPLTELNVERYKNFKTPFNIKNSRQAMYAFKGDTYIGLEPYSMSSSDIKYTQKHLRILSGLYGLISPLDLVQPYRLEMGTKFPCEEANNLYQFWKKPITEKINQILAKEKVLINLASKEYFSAIDDSKVKGRIITPIFKEKKNNEYKIVSFYAKKARGMMSRYIIDNRVECPNDIKKFDRDGYLYNEDLSAPDELVFCR